MQGGVEMAVLAVSYPRNLPMILTRDIRKIAERNFVESFDILLRHASDRMIDGIAKVRPDRGRIRRDVLLDVLIGAHDVGPPSPKDRSCVCIHVIHWSQRPTTLEPSDCASAKALQFRDCPVVTRLVGRSGRQVAHDM